MFPDLNVITFDGNSVAVYKAASYVVTKLANEMVTVLVQECPADADSPVSQSDLSSSDSSSSQVFIFISSFSKASLEFHQPVSGGAQHHSQLQPHHRQQAPEEGTAPSFPFPRCLRGRADLSNVNSVLLSALCQLALRQTSVQKVWL